MIRMPNLGALRRRKQRVVVTVSGVIAEIDPADQDDEGALHQIFTVEVTEVLEDRQKSGVELGQVVTVAIRFGDKSGMAEPIAGLTVGEAIELCGVYVRAEDAYATPDGERNPVIHFTHRPLGYVEYRGRRYE